MKAAPASLTLPLPHIEPLEAGRAPLRRILTAGPSRSGTGPRRRQAWLAVRMTNLPLAAVMRCMTAEASTAQQRPLAILDDDRYRSVLCCNDLAHARGVRPGQRLNTAITLYAQLDCLARSRSAEVRLLESLALLCRRFTPMIVIEPPSELLLEVRGSLKLFGGIETLMEALIRDLEAAGIAANLAISTTPRSAQWFARSSIRRVVALDHRAEALAELPLHVLEWPQDIQQRLLRFGVSTVGELMRLPRQGLARRIGRDYLRQLDQALEREPDLRPAHLPPARYRDRILLDFDIETTTLAESVLAHRLGRLRRFLRRHDAAIDELTVSLLHRDLPATLIPLKLAAPCDDTAHLIRLLHERLKRLQLPAPIREMRIHAPRCSRAVALTAALCFEPTPSHDQDPDTARSRLLEQLRARLGTERIRTIEVYAERRPARTQQHAAAQPDPPPSCAVIPALPPRPLWLLAQPRSMRVAGARPQGLGDDPERIQTGWWDEAFTDRDYFVLHSASGAVGWVYCDRRQQGRWFLQGLFA
ncbi:hypothetical protein ACG33_05400 [Steroidobacter denitrificans]|uniref:UmuC domain-containing protein n=1 Tax=Steroidobacter denitrificans TaxID=465721 RepID=A0A127FA84_STEDE|nr:DNA polymerase Y family protein [Steroidobacter denitrificans]AMN46541.1 hypothetical protein ACG33_05400 [Steroidobacter denitrificans]